MSKDKSDKQQSSHDNSQIKDEDSAALKPQYRRNELMKLMNRNYINELMKLMKLMKVKNFHELVGLMELMNINDFNEVMKLIKLKNIYELDKLIKLIKRSELPWPVQIQAVAPTIASHFPRPTRPIDNADSTDDNK